MRSLFSHRALAGAVLWLLWSPTTPAAAAPRCPRGARTEQHTVAKGDTLSGIAHGIGLRIADLLESNPGLAPDALSEGQKLLVCVPRARKSTNCGRDRQLYEHRVRSGESLARIATRYATSEKDLLARNGALGGDATALRAGQTLTVCTQPTRYRASAQCEYRTPIFEHRVVEGEWLAEIASRYGVRQSEVVRLNARLRKNPDYLRPGQKLRVCPDIAPRTREQIRHGVRPGETLASIAERYDLNPRQLLRFQRGRLANPDVLRVGQRLLVWKDGDIAPGFADEDEDEDAQLTGGIQLPEGQHYVMKNPKLAWGTPETIRLIQGAAADYRKRARHAAPMRVGDISRKGGGRFPPHKSHRSGQDVDIAYVLRGDAVRSERFITANANNLDAAGTWRLLQSFLHTGKVRYIFLDYPLQALLYDYARDHGVSQSELDELFQYPRSRRRAYGIIRDDPGHDDHFHVRFR